MFNRIKTLTVATLVAAGMLSFGTEAQAKAPRMKHVILIASDGFSADVMTNNPGKFPNIERLMKQGSYTLQARSVLPSSSAINWATLLMGAGSEVHGFTEWGSQTPEVKPAYLNQYGMFPGIFGEVRQQHPEAVTGVIYSWDGIGYLFEKKAVNLDCPVKTDEEVAAKSIEFIADKKPELAFVYFSEPDHTGHTLGWESPEFVTMCQKIDSLVGVVVNTVEKSLDPKSTAVIFTADHGGKGTGHGGKTMNEMLVPYVIVGRNIPADKEIDRIVMKYDNAPTIADMLGLQAPDQWYGKSILR